MFFTVLDGYLYFTQIGEQLFLDRVIFLNFMIYNFFIFGEWLT